MAVKMKNLLEKSFDKDYPKDLPKNENEFVGGVYDVYKKGFETAYSIKESEKRLDLANQQLLGYYQGKWSNLIGMVEGMGLTSKEWRILKKDYEPYLDESDIKEINEHFNNVFGIK